MLVKVLAGLSVSVFLFVAAAFAHTDVEVTAEEKRIDARLFTADASNGEVVAVDLPGGEVVARLATPPHMIYLAIGANRNYVYALRGKNSDRDYVTVIDTGFEPGSEQVRSPFIARSFVGNIPDGVQQGFTATVRGKDAIIMEGDAELLIFEDGDFGGFGEVSVKRFPLSTVDHYAFLDAGDYIYIGHLGHGYVQVLDSDTGEEVARIEGCPVLHGKAKDRVSGRLFYGCQPFVLVVGTRGDEIHKVVARIPYPEEQRIGNFYIGKDQVIWGYNEGALPMIYRLDAGEEPLAFDVLPVEKSVRQGTSADGNYLFILTYAGMLEIRDGATGEVLHRLEVSGPFDPDIEEKIDRAVMPDFQTFRDHVFLSLPHEGRVAEIDPAAGKIVRYLETGGEPTRLAIAFAETHDHDDAHDEHDHEN